MAGELYVVSTPIGNLEDITLRALRILKEVDIIAAEDTRHTRQLLSHFDIHGKKLVSCHAFNEHDKVSNSLPTSKTVLLSPSFPMPELPPLPTPGFFSSAVLWNSVWNRW